MNATAPPPSPDVEPLVDDWKFWLCIGVFGVYLLPSIGIFFVDCLCRNKTTGIFKKQQHCCEPVIEFVKRQKKDLVEFSRMNNVFVRRTVYFLWETIRSKMVFILLVTVIWSLRVRREEIDIDKVAYKQKRENYALLNTAVTGVLTFLLTMRLNNALSTNRAAFDRFGSTCGYLEIFYQRVLEKRVHKVPDLLVFIPYIIKHEMRKTFNADNCKITYAKKGDLEKDESKKEEVELKKVFDNYDYQQAETVDEIPEGGVCERIEQKILATLSTATFPDTNNKVWQDKAIMDAWTQYRVSANSIGGTLNYGAPVSFSVVVWLALAVYIYTTPYLIPADSNEFEATVASTVSVTCLLLLHINAENISNPFNSSQTFQTVTKTAENCTQNMIDFKLNNQLVSLNIEQSGGRLPNLV